MTFFYEIINIPTIDCFMFISKQVTDWVRIQKKTNRGKGETARGVAETWKREYPLKINTLS
jgi:hypothetical protein